MEGDWYYEERDSGNHRSVCLGGLLMLQGTPKVSEEIAADVVQTLHPQAEVENVTDTTVGSDRAYRVAYYEGGKAGVVAVSENGQLMH